MAPWAERGQASQGDVAAADLAALCQEPRLVETLRECFQERSPERVWVTAPTAFAGREALDAGGALAWATASAASLLAEPPTVGLVGADQTVLWEGCAKQALAALRAMAPGETGRPSATAVVSTWNKADDVCANLEALQAQVEPFEEIVLVDNASKTKPWLACGASSPTCALW